MKILKISSYYNSFLNYYYKNNQDIIHKDYSTQYNHLMQQKFAWSNFFETNFKKHNIDCIEIIYNSYPLQSSWAKENHIIYDKDILINQIKFYKPDVVFFQDILNFSSDFINKIRHNIKSVYKIFGHCCSPFPIDKIKDFKSYDFFISCSPFVDILKKNNIKVYEFSHGFESSLLDEFDINNNFFINDFIFIGSLIQSDSFHNERIKIIEQLIEQNLNISIFASNIQNDSFLKLKIKQLLYLFLKQIKSSNLKTNLSNISILKKIMLLDALPKKNNISKKIIDIININPIFGLEMYKALSRSKIGFNSHGGIAGDFAANMRMFEVTGVGSLLLTDHKGNIQKYFEPDLEIITYKNANDCIEKTKWLLENENERKKIAVAGQKRCLKDHTLQNRINYLSEIIRMELNN